MAKRAAPHDPGWTKAEARLVDALDTPFKIQSFLDATEYSDDPIYRSPRRVMRDRKAHCVDGALFACACLRRHGRPPLVLDMTAENDDDHFLAVVRAGRFLGAVAKSNFVGIRFREPLFRTVRELSLSYFEDYYNTAGEKTLRGHSALVDLSRFDAARWETEDAGIEAITEAIGRMRHTPLLTPAQRRALSPVDPLRLKAGLLGSNPKGLYVPGSKKKA